MTLIWQQIRQLLFILDNVVYTLIGKVYELFMYVANINFITNNPVLEGLIHRVYLIIGIFMLFKVSFSILHYIVDPNAFSDKAKGFGKLITNSLVSIVLLVTIPWLFNQAYELQKLVVTNNLIPKLVIGDSGISSFDSTTEGIQSTAKDVQFALFSAFYTINYSQNAGIPSCEPKPEEGKYTTNVIGSVDMVNNCLDDFLGGTSPTGNDELNRYGAYLEDFFKYKDNNHDCKNGVCDERDFGAFAKLLWWKKDTAAETDFVINYTPIISTIAGGWLLFILITFSIDLAARIFKLMFLQMTAPIAVVSYIDPKESASNSKLRQWVGEFAKTYLSLFLRLAVIFLAIQLVKMLTNMLLPVLPWNGSTDVELFYGAAKPEGSMHMFVYVILILGIFTFAKQVPGMIERIFGIKGTGEMSLNPLKNPLVSGFHAGVLGGAAGAWAGVRAGAEAGAPVRGALVGGVRGISSGANQGLKAGMFGSVRSKTYKEMTGNDMKTFNPAQPFLKPGSKGKIDEVNNPLKEAKAQKAAAEEMLKRAQVPNNEAVKLFNKHNIDTSSFVNSDGSTNKAAIDAQKVAAAKKQNEAKGKISVAAKDRNKAITVRNSAMSKSAQAVQNSEALQNQMNQLNNQISQAKVARMQARTPLDKSNIDAQIKNWERELADVQAAKIDAQSEIAKANAKIEKANADIAAADAIIKENRTIEADSDNIIAALGKFESNRNIEVEISKNIQEIDHDIKVLESEKSQRKQFYGVEESTIESVDSAVKNVANRANKSVNNQSSGSKY